jgi:hypothetical protein
MSGKVFHLISRFAAILILVSFSASIAFASGGKPATKLVNVADTRTMGAGFSKFIADIYNSNLWLFGVLVVVTMSLLGAILGYGFDRLLMMLGLEMNKLDHHE